MTDSIDPKPSEKKKSLIYIYIGLAVLVIIGLIVAVIILTGSKKDGNNNTAQSSNSSSTNKTSTKAQSVVIGGITYTGTADCTIPNKVLMSDFLGYPLSTLVAKYGGVSQLHPTYASQVIRCENDHYYIAINATKADQVADYIEIQEKDFGTCDAGINNVLPWVDKSLNAIGMDPTTKGSATYDTEDDRSQVEYSDYMVGDKKSYLTVECNVSGDYIGVLTVLMRQ